jgi:hypothetical protein
VNGCGGPTGIGLESEVPVAADFGLEGVLGVVATRHEKRRDAVADRGRWQFAPRLELVGRLCAAGVVAP